MIVGALLLFRIFSLTQGSEDLAGRIDPSYGGNNIYGIIFVCLSCLMDVENLVFLPWVSSIFLEKSGGFPNMWLFQSVKASKCLYLITLTLILGTATESSLATKLNLLLSVALCLYSFCVVVLKLKLEDIAQYELKLVPKDAVVGLGMGVFVETLDPANKVKDLESMNPLTNIVEVFPVVTTSNIVEDALVVADESGEERMMRASEEFLRDSVGYFPSTIPFPDEQVKVLQQQLRELNAKPLEYIPLLELKREIQEIISKMNRGEECGEDMMQRLDHLLRCLENSREYKEEQEQELVKWVDDNSDFFEEALVLMRRIIPKDIFECSISDLKSVHLMSAPLAKRIFDKKCLWLIRMKKDYINKIHESDLLGKYSFQAQNLDLVELSAIYCSLPNDFANDFSGKKKQLKISLLMELKKIVTLHRDNRLPANKIRNPVYKDHQADSSRLLC
jgi:hypothetical protein